jgi:hypothetical protein
MTQGKDRNFQAGLEPGDGPDTERRADGKTPSSAQNASFETGAGDGALGYDSPPAQSQTTHLSDPEVQGVHHLDPYYPPGSSQNKAVGEDEPVSTEDDPQP